MSHVSSLTPFRFLSFSVSLQHPLVSSLVSRGNSAKIVNFTGSEPSLRLVWAQNQPTLGKIPGILRVPGKPRVYLENSRYFAGLLGFASDFGPDQLSDTGKLESCQNGAPTCWFSKISLSEGTPAPKERKKGNQPKGRDGRTARRSRKKERKKQTTRKNCGRSQPSCGFDSTRCMYVGR